MTATATKESRAVPTSTGSARLSAALWRRAWLRATLTLSPPLAWFLVIYLASLVVMLITAFWSVNPFTNNLVHTWTLANFQQIFTSTYLTIIGRTVGMAALVTVTDAVLAFPFAYFMARVASPRGRQLLFTAVLLPLWASYLARVYAWIVILQKGGTLSWFFTKIGLGAVNIGYTNTAMWLVFSYIWLPFMIIPVYAALERIPDSLLEASGDLGARNWRTLRSVLLPLALPGVVAGLDLHVLAHPGRLHHAAADRRGQLQLHRQRHLLQPGHGEQPAVRRGPGRGAHRDHDRLPARRAAARRVRVPVMEML